jgi:hypothetical protein
MVINRRSPFVQPWVEWLETRTLPSAATWSAESFDSTPVGTIPNGWSQWSDNPAVTVGVSTAQALSKPGALTVASSMSTANGRVWVTNPAPADADVSTALFVNSLIPAEVMARGSNLGTTGPSYYAAAVTRGLTVQLVKVINGVATPLAQLNSARWFDQNWVRLTLSVQGSHLIAQVFRPDTAQYLNSQGQWQAAVCSALTAADTSLAGPGQAGLARPASYTGTLTFDDFSVTLPGATESFDGWPVATLPSGWAQWSSTGNSAFAISSALALSAPNGLAATASISSLAARAWVTSQQAADSQATAAIFLNTQIPAQVFLRGSNLNTAIPSYYAAAVTRGLTVQLVKVVNGSATALAQLNSAQWFNQSWVRVTLSLQGSLLSAQVFRPDTAQYLNSQGQWQSATCWATTASDATLSGPGQAGLGRPASYTGTLTFDDFSVLPAPGDTTPPTVAFTNVTAGSVLSGTVPIGVSAVDNVVVARVEFYVDTGLRSTITAAPYNWSFDTTTASNGTHTLTVVAYDLAGNVGQASVTVTTQNQNALTQPTISRHYPNIRIAELAYGGMPFASFEDQLLQNSVDLVITDSASVSNHVHLVAPNTPQLAYTNTSSLYLGLLTDWLNYADAHGLSREQAFYHVRYAVPFSGNSPSSQPVDWFWGVYRVGSTLTDLTTQSQGTSPGGVPFGKAGESVAIGYTDPFREINVGLIAPAGGGWSATWEYVSAVDAAGNPTSWSPLQPLSDTTAGMTQTGQVLFDPPAGWKTASLGGSARLYYVRLRTTSGGTVPVAGSLRGRDYVNSQGTTSGIIPAFDFAADANHDGYLNDAEYSHRSPGMDARFIYESRDFAAYYGQMRFATNPADAGFVAWAQDYAKRFLASMPFTSGLFMDNSNGLAPVRAADVLEPASNYSADYAAMVNAVAQAIAPDWVLANTVGGGTSADLVAQKVQGYFEEFALRPLADNYIQFEALAALAARRAALTSPSPYAVFDSLPTGGSPTDSRTQLATLASYYLLTDSNSTFLDFFGGYEPATTWARHWSAAAAYNVGQPTASWSVFATGADPSNSALTYRVYGRTYTNALVLYKPLSFGNNVTGSLSNATATTHALGGTYHILQADGTLGPAVTQITLRNGEGAILVK